MDDKNLMIRVLEWATKQKQFTFQELCVAANINEVEKSQLKLLIHHKSLLFHNHSTFYSSVDKPNSNIEIFASADEHFRYLEYIELKEARESATGANKKSLVAIWIAVISMLCSIGLSIASMVSDINVPDRLYDAIKNSNQSVYLNNSDPTYK